MERVGVEGKLARHEADFDERPHAAFEKTVVDLIDIREVIDGIAPIVFVVNADFIMKDGMETDVVEISGLLHGYLVVAVALTKGQDCAS
jgi:hypothetical protein